MMSTLEIRKNLSHFRRWGSRLFSVNTKESLKTNDEVTPKRYAKPHIDRKRQSFSPNFIPNLFAGFLDKRNLQYPLILQNDEIDSLLKHSSEVENLLNSIPPTAELTRKLLKSLNTAELFGLTVSPKYGGLGYTETEAKFIHECTGVNLNIGRFLSCNEDLGIRLLSDFGTHEQKQLYLPKLVAGDSFISFAYLEDGPIVDLSLIESSAINDTQRQGYLLNAKKKWVHHANLADLFIVLTKSPEISEAGGTILLNTYIVDRKTPGVSVHELKSSTAKEFGLYEVDLQNVFVPYSNLLGTDNNGFSMLQSSMSHNFLSSAALSMSLLKKMIHSAVGYSKEKMLAEKPLMLFDHIQANICSLVAYTYILETVVYFISARFDAFEKPDLFLETIIAQILSVEVLEKSLRLYIQTIGPNCFKESDVINEALKVLKYSMVFEENGDYLKLLLSSYGIQNPPSKQVEKMKKLWNPLDNPLEAILNNLKSAEGKIAKIKQKMNLNLKMELHSVFQNKADDLEMNLAKFKLAVEELYFRFGNSSLEEEHLLIKFAEIVAYLYAQMACLSRASDAYCNNLHNCNHDLNIAPIACNFASLRIQELCNNFFFYEETTLFQKQVGKITFLNKEYPAEHPLIRTY